MVTGLVVVVVVIVVVVCFDIGGLVFIVEVVPTGRYLIISLRGPLATPAQCRQGEISKTGTTASMAKMASESIDGRGTLPIQESILAPVSPIASFLPDHRAFPILAGVEPVDLILPHGFEYFELSAMRSESQDKEWPISAVGWIYKWVG